MPATKINMEEHRDPQDFLKRMEGIFTDMVFYLEGSILYVEPMNDRNIPLQREVDAKSFVMRQAKWEISPDPLHPL